MRIMVFDTETTGLDRPFMYQFGFVVYDTDLKKVLCQDEYLLSNIWYNKELMSGALFKDREHSKDIVTCSLQDLCINLLYIFNHYNIKFAFAYNCDFDIKVMNFNCDFYNIVNPFKINRTIIKDIRMFALKYICNENYKNFCDSYSLYTDNGNYSTTAENVYKYINKTNNFEENHTALSDSLIELEILKKTIINGADIINENLPKVRSLYRQQNRVLTIKKDNQVYIEIPFNNCIKRKDTIYLR